MTIKTHVQVLVLRKKASYWRPICEDAGQIFQRLGLPLHICYFTQEYIIASPSDLRDRQSFMAELFRSANSLSPYRQIP